MYRINKSYKSTFNLKIQLNNCSNKEREKNLIKSIKIEKVNPIKINEGNSYAFEIPNSRDNVSKFLKDWF